MNEIYSEVRENLRRQHSMNLQEIHGRKDAYLYDSLRYGYEDVQEDKNKNAFWTFSFKAKVFTFLLSVLLFSFYLYGEQDVKKGAYLAWNDFQTQITKMEQDQPTVKQTVKEVKNIYSEIRDFLETYFNIY